MKGWDKIECYGCGGNGMTSQYTIDGGDFMGAQECSVCGGSGKIWRTPKGSLAMWPGGPFLGKLSKREGAR